MIIAHTTIDYRSLILIKNDKYPTLILMESQDADAGRQTDYNREDAFSLFSYRPPYPTGILKRQMAVVDALTSAGIFDPNPDMYFNKVVDFLYLGDYGSRLLAQKCNIKRVICVMTDTEGRPALPPDIEEIILPIADASRNAAADIDP